MSDPLDNTEEYNAEDFVPPEYAESVTEEHVQHLSSIHGAALDENSPIPELDHTQYYYTGDDN